MPDSKLVLVTGATGAIGPAVVAELLEHGYRIRTVARQRAKSLPDHVDQRQGDVANAADLAASADGVVAIVHLAARLHLAGPPSRDLAAYQRVNVDGTANVVSAARGARVVFASTIAVYGPSAGDPFTEDSPTRPETPYARTKLQAENLVVCRGPGSPARPNGTVLRFGAVYGPRVKGNYRALVDALATGRFVPVGTGRNRRTLLHERDLARAIVHVLESPHAAGQIFNVTDGAVHTTDAIVAAICAALGRPAPRWHVPASLAIGAASVYDTLTGVASTERPSLVERITRYTEDVAVDGSLIQRSLGFTPMYSLEAGWRDVVASWKPQL